MGNGVSFACHVGAGSAVTAMNDALVAYRVSDAYKTLCAAYPTVPCLGAASDDAAGDDAAGDDDDEPAGGETPAEGDGDDDDDDDDDDATSSAIFLTAFLYFA